MTKRLCVLGNSHIACLREAWFDNPGRWLGIDPTFIGAHRGLLLETEIRDGHMMPVSEEATAAFHDFGGVTSVDLSAFDGFVVVGCLVAMPQASFFYADIRWPALPSFPDTDVADMTELLVSYPAARAALIDHLSTRLGLALIRKLRPATDKPIWLVGGPRVSERLMDQEKSELRAYAAAVRAGDGPALSALFEQAAATATSAAGAAFIPQPHETIVSDCLTAATYMDGAIRLTKSDRVPQPDDDIGHGNALYGALVIDQIAARVQPT